MYIPICRPLKKPSNEALRKGGGGGGGWEGAPWLLATSPATNNKYPATWNLSDNPACFKSYFKLTSIYLDKK